MIDRFAGTAEYYAKYRPGYPSAVFDRVRSAFRLDGNGRLLDLGCGTGEIARPLHTDFEDVVGLDISQEMIDEAERRSALAGITNITWMRMPAEELSECLGPFRLATLGNAFHWMQQAEVLKRVYALIEPTGGVVILGNPGGFWAGDDPWEGVVQEVLERWLAQWRGARQGITPNGDGAEKVSIAASRFVDVELGEHRWQRAVDVDTIIGEVFSTSFASRAVLGEKADAFAADLRKSLLALEPSGRFIERIRTEFIFGYKH
ncbi:MAG: class I SAM-dependent methyltransferase [Thermomicrobiales bacterium]